MENLTNLKDKCKSNRWDGFLNGCMIESSIKEGVTIMNTVLEVANVEKYYGNKSNLTKALDGISFSVEEGGFVGIMGASGSGKTTLLNCVSTIDRVTSGKIIVNDIDVTRLRGNHLNQFRREELGFIFQDFNLLDTFSLEDNIYLPMVLSGKKYPEMSQKLKPIAQQLGITQLLKKFPYEVSGGQKQRAAVARALITQPKLILADEPTGALDSRAADELLRLFKEINQQGQTILMVTHSVKAASTANRVLFIKDGEVFHQLYRGNMSNEELYEKISATLTALTTGGEDNA